MMDDDEPRRAEMRRLADAVRDVIERFVATSAPIEVFAGVADELQRIADRFEGYPQGNLYIGFAEAANAGRTSGGPTDHSVFDHSPLMGRANPLAPPLVPEVHDDRIVCHVTFGSAYEGPPGCVHGGFVAAAFDELLGLTQSLSGAPGMTGRLTIHYRQPTPLHTPLRLEGVLANVDGRKILTVGRMTTPDGTLTAEAEGLFISIDFAKFAELKARREAAAG